LIFRKGVSRKLNLPYDMMVIIYVLSAKAAYLYFFIKTDLKKYTQVVFKVHPVSMALSLPAYLIRLGKDIFECFPKRN